MKKKLCKSRKNKIVDGVCAGVADYFNIDPTIVRLVTVIFCCFKGAGFLLYIVACIVMPYGEPVEDDDIDNLKSANMDSDDENSKKSTDTPSGQHSDEEFNKFFEK